MPEQRGGLPGSEIVKVSGRPTNNPTYPYQREADYMTALAKGRTGLAEDPSVNEMRKNRRINARTASGMGGMGQGGGSVSFATGRPQDPMFYWKQNNLPFDYSKPEELAKIRAYCNTPDAPILMADGTFKPIGEIVAGEQVMGWAWVQGERGHWRKRLQPTSVLAIQRRTAPMIVEATMESGQVIRCTPDHQWANFYYSPAGRGNEYEPMLRPSQGGRGDGVRRNTMARLTTPVEPLTERKMIDAAGYLAGIIDADGTVTGGEIRIGQSPRVNGEICTQIEQALNVLGLDYRVSDRSVDVRLWILKGTLENRLRLREWMPLSVKVRKAWEDRRTMRWTGGRDQVASVVEMGPGEVVSMQTETGNYIAWGYASKNCRIIYATHPVIASAIDVYSKYPMTGMEISVKDDALVDFYSTLFFDQLDYEDFLVDVGREKWTVGEAWPLGSFNETLGVWEDDELLNPDDIEVIRSPFLKEPRFEMRLPKVLRDIIESREPKWEFEALMRSYPELKNFTGDEARMPVSNVLLKQIKFKADTFSKRGLPILMRGFRAIMQEEMLNAAQDAISSRLYTPLVLAKLGASASDLGTQNPWIPTEDDLADFEESLDAALAGDFRVLTHHFALQMESVFGRETMPNMDQDFERLTERQLQVFGMSKTMLSGAGQGETFAADAINRDLISQLLTGHQRDLNRLFMDRARVVAEAQEHYDYEERGGKRYVIMEEVYEVDEETGEGRIVEQPKLLVPELKFKAMTMKDEENERQLIEALAASGIPISMKTRLWNLPLDLDDEVQRKRDEQVQMAVEAQETRKATFLALDAQGLPIPEDLERDFRAKAMQAREPGEDLPQVLPSIGTSDPADTSALAPTPEDLAAAEMAEQQGGEPGVSDHPSAAIIPMPRNRMVERTRPEESDSERANMPKPAALNPDLLERRGPYYLRTVAARTVGEGAEQQVVEDETWQAVSSLTELGDGTGEKEGPNRLLSGPRHIGLRRHVAIDPDVPMDEQGLA